VLVQAARKSHQLEQSTAQYFGQVSSPSSRSWLRLQAYRRAGAGSSRRRVLWHDRQVVQEQSCARDRALGKKIDRTNRKIAEADRVSIVARLAGGRCGIVRSHDAGKVIAEVRVRR